MSDMKHLKYEPASNIGQRVVGDYATGAAAKAMEEAIALVEIAAMGMKAQGDERNESRIKFDLFGGVFFPNILAELMTGMLAISYSLADPDEAKEAAAVRLTRETLLDLIDHAEEQLKERLANVPVSKAEFLAAKEAERATKQ